MGKRNRAEKMMLQRLLRLLNPEAGSALDCDALPAQDYKLAAAALLVHATQVDGHVDEAEHYKLRQLLRDHFEMKDPDIEEFIKLAECQERKAVDLYGFTRRLTKELDAEGRLEIIEMLWEIVYCDGVLHEYENFLVARVSDLLHVAPRERIRLKKMVKARFT